MSDSPLEMPDANSAGLIPTLNRKGFMNETLNQVSEAFVDYASTCAFQLLDMGCAYGVATLPALAAGANVTACDMDVRHVEILQSRVPQAQRAQLTPCVGEMPQIEFIRETFGAVHCARLVHFLTPEDVRLAFEQMAKWLRPGGKLFLVSDTPYAGYWSATVPDYLERKAAGEEWPGFIADTRPLLRPDSRKAQSDGPFHLNPMDPDILVREAERAGLIVEEARFLPSVSKAERERPLSKNQAGVIAVKP